MEKDTLYTEQVISLLEDPSLPVEVFPEIDSTNTYAKELLKAGRQAPFSLIADQQTAGRGRRGNTFFSPSSGLYYTLVIKPEEEEIAHAIAHTTIAAAVSVQQAIAECTGIETSIKWVNDLYLGQRKVCGILCEAPRDLNGNLMSIVIGIGINCVEQNFPDEIKDKAGALNAPRLERNALAAALTNRLRYWTTHLHDPELINLYRKHSFLLGRSVTFVQNGTEYSGIATDINEDGNLIININEQPFILSSGEVSLKSWEK